MGCFVGVLRLDGCVVCVVVYVCVCVCVCVCVMQVVFLWLDFEMSFFSECMLPGTIVCDLVCGVSKEWGC